MSDEHEIGNLKVKMYDTKGKTHEIADWFHTHYSHTVKNKKERDRVKKKANLDCYLEENERIYVIE